MKLRISLVILSTIAIFAMWYNSPMYNDANTPAVTVISPKKGDIYNSIIVRGCIEEGDRRSIRLQKSANIEKVNVKVGDKVKKGDILLTISEIEKIGSIQSVMNILPEIDEIDDIKTYYTPRAVMPTVSVSPEIASPIDGVITELGVKEGDTAIGYIPVLVISDFNNLLVSASVSELYIKDIKIGQEAEISGEAFGGKKYKAKVCAISPVAKQKTTLTGPGETTVDVTLEIMSENTNLKPGYTVDTKILTEMHEDTLSVPYSCIIQDNDTEYVFVIKEGKIKKKEVKTGFETESVVEIIRGINKNDFIVLNPTDELFDNMSVKAEVSEDEF